MPQAKDMQIRIRDFTADEVSVWLVSLQKDGKLAAESVIVAPLQEHRKAVETVRQRAQDKLASLIKARQDTIAANDAARARNPNAREAPVPEVPQLAPHDQTSNITFTWAVDRQTLDDWLRKEIADLPEIGKYVVVQPPRDPAVALRVRWFE